MDKQTRKELADLADRLSLIMTELDVIITYEHDKYDNLIQAHWMERLGETCERLDLAYGMLEQSFNILQNPDEE